MALPNLMTPASMDLGLGDGLRQQLLDAEEERKKKLLQQAKLTGAGAPPLGGAVQSLFGPGY